MREKEKDLRANPGGNACIRRCKDEKDRVSERDRKKGSQRSEIIPGRTLF